MNRHSSFFKGLALLSLLAAPARTQEVTPEPTQDRPHFMLEIDPATFAMNGYSAHARMALGLDSKWVLGFGVYGLDIPKLMVDMDPKNRDKGWDVRLTFGAGLFAAQHPAAGYLPWLSGNQCGAGWQSAPASAGLAWASGPSQCTGEQLCGAVWPGPCHAL